MRAKNNFIPFRFEIDLTTLLIKNTIKSQFPFVKFLGCWFHFGHCIFRNLCDYGLRKAYCESEELKRLFKKVVALPLMPSVK